MFLCPGVEFAVGIFLGHVRRKIVNQIEIAIEVVVVRINRDDIRQRAAD